MTNMDVTRRTLARAVIASAIAMPSSAAPQPAAADQETLSAHESLRANADALAKVEVPMHIEPAFQFKA